MVSMFALLLLHTVASVGLQYASKSGHIRLAHEIRDLIESRAPCYGDSDDEEDDEPSNYTHDYSVGDQSKRSHLHNDGLSNGIPKPTPPSLAHDRPQVSFLKASSKRLQR